MKGLSEQLSLHITLVWEVLIELWPSCYLGNYSGFFQVSACKNWYTFQVELHAFSRSSLDTCQHQSGQMSSESDTIKLSFCWELQQLSNRNRELIFCVCYMGIWGHVVCAKKSSRRKYFSPMGKVLGTVTASLYKVTLPHFNILPLSRTFILLLQSIL